MASNTISSNIAGHSLKPTALTIAGSDSGGGAGIQADIQAFRYFDVFATTAITAVTAQNPKGVRSIQAVEPSIVADQIDAVFESFAVGAVKTGMLFNSAIIETVVASLATHNAPLVVDPVMLATSGAALLKKDAIATLRQKLLPRAALITPNLPEAAMLLNRAEIAAGAEKDAARELADDLGTAVLLKGGHADSANATDWLVCATGVYAVSTPLVKAVATHGTGCALSAAITANLARKNTMLDSVIQAKAYIHGNLDNCRRVGAETFAMTPPQILPLEKIKVEKG